MRRCKCNNVKWCSLSDFHIGFCQSRIKIYSLSNWTVVILQSFHNHFVILVLFSISSYEIVVEIFISFYFQLEKIKKCEEESVKKKKQEGVAVLTLEFEI